MIPLYRRMVPQIFTPYTLTNDRLSCRDRARLLLICWRDLWDENDVSEPVNIITVRCRAYYLSVTDDWKDSEQDSAAPSSAMPFAVKLSSSHSIPSLMRENILARSPLLSHTPTRYDTLD